MDCGGSTPLSFFDDPDQRKEKERKRCRATAVQRTSWLKIRGMENTMPMDLPSQKSRGARTWPSGMIPAMIGNALRDVPGRGCLPHSWGGARFAKKNSLAAKDLRLEAKESTTHRLLGKSRPWWGSASEKCHNFRANYGKKSERSTPPFASWRMSFVAS